MIKSIACDFVIYVVLFACYLTFISDVECGIPIKLWLEVHLGLFLMNSVQKFILIWIVRRYIRFRMIYNLIATMMLAFVVVGWLVYGNILFFSDANDCDMIPETKPMYNMMMFFIVFGYV